MNAFKNQPSPTGVKRIFAFLLLSAFVVAPLFAEQLPLKLYTSADGLASSAVTHVAKDSRGFLWFSTRDGLSRFDGREFVNYRISDHEAAQTFWSLLETREGHFWISTGDGLYRVDPQQSVEVSPAAADAQTGGQIKLNGEKISDLAPRVLFEDSRGRVWAGAGDLYLVAERDRIILQKIELGAQARGNRTSPNVVAITETPDGSLWFASMTGVSRRFADGKIIFYPIASLSDYEGTQNLVADKTGRIWVVHSGGLIVFYPEPISEIQNLPNFSARHLQVEEQFLGLSGKIALPDKAGLMIRFNRVKSAPDEAQDDKINGVFQSADQKIWIAAGKDLYTVEGENYRRLRDANNFPIWTGKIVEDARGDLWIGTSGILKFTPGGLTSYGTIDGLSRPNIQSIRQASDGTLYFLNGIDWRVSRLTANGLETARLNLPETAKMLWTSNAALIDRKGDWWALAENGLYRFAANSELKALEGKAPAQIYGLRDGLKGNSLYCAFEDSKGNLWLSTRGRPEWSGLTKYDPQTGKFHVFTAAEGFPETQSAVSFAEDDAGSLWFGFYGGGLARYRDGRFTDFSMAENLPQGTIFGLYVDEKNRLWLGTSRDGVARVDDLSADRLSFKRYTTSEGLISNNVRTLTGDFYGNIYAGTVRGISRISTDSGNIRHFTTADGLAADFVTASLRDRSGTLWFGTTDGISRLVPAAEAPQKSAPQIWISALSIAGNHYPVSEFGQREVAGIDVGASENNLQIAFLSVGDAIRYQYKLDGADHAGWSQPSAERRVNFANLAPGSYRFLVRAVDEDGQTSEVPALVGFTINPPFYRSWWFLALAFLTAAAAIFTLDRYRVAKTRQVQKAYDELQKAEKERREAEAALQKSREERLAELERVRTRIATDLHDDIGSSLTQIAVLSQAAQSQLQARHETIASPLERISDVSIELVNAMSDIVWAINPRKDNLRDLVQRMRRFAADVLTAKRIKFDFVAPEIESKLQLGANLRREVFAIYKETVNNVVKHSGATRAEIFLKITGDLLQMQIADNGGGFDLEAQLHNSVPPNSNGGNGLINIQRRGRELGGRCEIISFPGGGTTVLLEIPLHQENPPSRIAGENGRGNRLE